MVLTDAQRDSASKIALWLSSKRRVKTTRISRMSRRLWNQVGGRRYKRIVMFYLKQINRGLGSKRAGPNFLKAFIHPERQHSITTLDRKLHRENVMPLVLDFVDQEIAEGAFIKATCIDEDIALLRGPIVYDTIAAREDEIRNFSNTINSTRNATGMVRSMLNSGRMFAVDDFEDESSSHSAPSSLDDDYPESRGGSPQRDDVDQDDDINQEDGDDEEDQDEDDQDEDDAAEQKLIEDEIAAQKAIDDEQFRIQMNYLSDEEKKGKKKRVRENYIVTANYLNLVSDEEDRTPLKKQASKQVLRKADRQKSNRRRIDLEEMLVEENNEDVEELPRVVTPLAPRKKKKPVRKVKHSSKTKKTLDLN